MINLVVPRQEAKHRLEDRVTQGKELLNEPIASERELDQVEGRFNKWSDYNARLLELIFSDRSEADKYRASVSPAVGLPVDKQIELFRMDVSSRIRQLESHIEQLELIPMADNARSLHGPSNDQRTDDGPQYGNPDLESRKKVLRRVHQIWQASQNYQLLLEYHDVADNSQEGRVFVALVDEGYIDAKLRGTSDTSTKFAWAEVRGLTYKGKQELGRDTEGSSQNSSSDRAAGENVPSSIRDSLQRFEVDHPNPRKVAFIMMQFGKGPPHDKIARTIKAELEKHGITGLRADDREYHEELFSNVRTYMHGCGFGVAVFEQVEKSAFNPNVALEVGYMLALNKPICLFKEKTLPALQADIASRLYREFNAYDPESTIPPELSNWLSDNQ